MAEIKILIVDDHDLYRDGLIGLLADHRDLRVIGDTWSAQEGLALAAGLQPDVVLVDLHMPGMSGLEAIHRLAGTAPHARVIALTVSHAHEDVMAVISAGAAGYLLKDASIEEIVAAIRAVARGEAMISSRVTAEVLEALRTLPPTPKANGDSALTPREREVAELVVRGLENPEIAEALYLSPHTVKNHVSNIIEKLEVTNRLQAAVRVVRAGLA
jgi:DNA-binding NarL/FixJ family response regulator